MKRTLLASIVLAGSALMFSGCASRGAVYVGGPPAPRVEYYGVAPGPEYVWLPGYYNYGSSGYVWVGGRWGRRPHSGARWVDGGYARRGNHFEHREGRWHR